MTDVNNASVKQMVDRFLSWRLPENFRPDAGISFTPDFNVGTPYPMKHTPLGTNLFNATQAEAMVRHMVDGLKLEPDENAQSAPIQRPLNGPKIRFHQGFSQNSPPTPAPTCEEKIIRELRGVYDNLTPGAIERADLDGMAFSVKAAIERLASNSLPKSGVDETRLRAAAHAVMPILNRAESNASGFPEFDRVGPAVAEFRSTLAATPAPTCEGPGEDLRNSILAYAQAWWSRHMESQFLSARVKGDGRVTVYWRDADESGKFTLPVDFIPRPAASAENGLREAACKTCGSKSPKLFPCDPVDGIAKSCPDAFHATPSQIAENADGEGCCVCFGDTGFQASTFKGADDKERCDLCGLPVAATQPQAGALDREALLPLVIRWMPAGSDPERAIQLTSAIINLIAGRA